MSEREKCLEGCKARQLIKADAHAPGCPNAPSAVEPGEVLGEFLAPEGVHRPQCELRGGDWNSRCSCGLGAAREALAELLGEVEKRKRDTRKLDLLFSWQEYLEGGEPVIPLREPDVEMPEAMSFDQWMDWHLDQNDAAHPTQEQSDE